LANVDFLKGSIKMSAEDGALPQAYAAVIPQSGVYIGPSFVLVGAPKILGSLSSSWHHMPFTRDESKLLWDKSMEAMEIKVFGDFEIPTDAEEEVVEPELEQERHPPPSENKDEQSTSLPETEIHQEEPVMEGGERQQDPSTEEEEEEDVDSSDEDEEANEILNTYLGPGKYKEAVLM